MGPGKLVELCRSKYAAVEAELKPHQRRVVERMRNQPGLLVVHGLGSGKTLTSIATAEDQKAPTLVVAPAGLVANYEKELKKHVRGKPEAKYTIQSYAKTVRGEEPVETGVLVVDEAHRLRDPSTKSYQKLRKAKSKKRLLLTATPVYNHPADVAPLINLVAQEGVFPSDRSGFEDRYIYRKKVNPGFFARLRGVKPGEVPVLTRKGELRGKLRKWVDYHENTKDGFPDVIEETVEVPVSKQHSELLQGLMRNANPLFAWKVRANLPPSKQESKQLNAFMGAVRQASTSTEPYSRTLREHPKIDEAFNRFKEQVKRNPRHKAVIYSNYLSAGIDPYRRKLEEAGIPHAAFTGKVPKKVRDEAVRKFNRGELKALLVSSAGGEGLDLKGTRQIQILDPHWNEEKLKQVIGRGVRYKSHDDLPPEERNVKIERYLAVEPEPGAIRKFFGAKRPTSPDQYLLNIAKNKEELNRQMVELMRQKQLESAEQARDGR